MPVPRVQRRGARVRRRWSARGRGRTRAGLWQQRREGREVARATRAVGSVGVEQDGGEEEGRAPHVTMLIAPAAAAPVFADAAAAERGFFESNFALVVGPR